MTAAAFLVLAALFRVAVGRPDTAVALGLGLLAALAVLRSPIAGAYVTLVVALLRVVVDRSGQGLRLVRGPLIRPRFADEMPAPRGLLTRP